MKKLLQVVICTLLSLLSIAVFAQKPKNTIDAEVMFTELRSNAPVGGCGCFWMQGGTGELALPLWRNFSFVAEANGETTGKNNIPGFNVGLSLMTGLGGLRY